jgi:hypothetical protein
MAEGRGFARLRARGEEAAGGRIRLLVEHRGGGVRPFSSGFPLELPVVCFLFRSGFLGGRGVWLGIGNREQAIRN